MWRQIWSETKAAHHFRRCLCSPPIVVMGVDLLTSRHDRGYAECYSYVTPPHSSSLTLDTEVRCVKEIRISGDSKLNNVNICIILLWKHISDLK